MVTETKPPNLSYPVVVVTADDDVALPNSLVHHPSCNYEIMYIAVEEELNERRNGWNLDDDGGDARYFADKMR